MGKGKVKKLPELPDYNIIEFKDAPSIIWIKVTDAVSLLWEGNPKLHDMGGIAESIALHGFQELPKFDKFLGIKAGNGRIEALAWMEANGGYELPRGTGKIIETGEWVLPILIGTDAVSVNMALAYAIDSNNLTIAGGDFTAYDQARAWERDKYLILLNELAKANTLPVSVDGDDIDFMSYITSSLPDISSFKEYGEEIEDEVEYIICPECGYRWPK